jgi:signal transduction histidine kinase
MFSSFKFRLVLLYTGVTLLTLVVFRLTSTELIKRLLYEDLDTSLAAEADWVARIVTEYEARHIPDSEIREEITSRSVLNPRKELIEVRNASGELYYASPNLASGGSLMRLQSASAPVSGGIYQGKPFRIARKSTPQHHVFIGYPLDDINAAIGKMLWSMVLLLPAVIVAVIVGGMFLVSYFVRPLKELSRYSEDLLNQPLDRELEVRIVARKDEIGSLVSHLNTVVLKMRNAARQALSFSSMTSHELRRPLAMIRNDLEAALRPELSRDDMTLRVVSAYDESLRMSHIVDDLLNLCTLEAGTFRLNKTMVSVRSFFKDVQEEVRFLAPERDVTISADLEPDLLVNMDIDRMRQVLFNLVDNALHHVSDGGRISIGHGVREGRLAITVSDNGRGIPDDELPRVFDSFYRGSESARPGAGLGLTLVKLIVEAHGGEVQIHSTVGQGTVFDILIPGVQLETVQDFGSSPDLNEQRRGADRDPYWAGREPA